MPRDRTRRTTPTQPQTMRRTPQGNIEMMPKKEILDFKPARRLEPVDGEHSNRVQDCERRIG